MIKPKYMFLTLSLIELTVGFSNAGQNAFFYLSLPVGAILFGLFLVAQVLEKESALYNEQKCAAEALGGTQKAQARPVSTQPKVAHDPVLTTAHS